MSTRKEPSMINLKGFDLRETDFLKRFLRLANSHFNPWELFFYVPEAGFEDRTKIIEWAKKSHIITAHNRIPGHFVLNRNYAELMAIIEDYESSYNKTGHPSSQGEGL